MTTMRAKMRVGSVMPSHNNTETLMFCGVSASKYPEDGSDENNTYAKFSPSATFQLHLANPDLVGKFAVGDTFYVDFTPAPK